jgi:hypothetical protein
MVRRKSRVSRRNKVSKRLRTERRTNRVNRRKMNRSRKVSRKNRTKRTKRTKRTNKSRRVTKRTKRLNRTKRTNKSRRVNRQRTRTRKIEGGAQDEYRLGKISPDTHFPSIVKCIREGKIWDNDIYLVYDDVDKLFIFDTEEDARMNVKEKEDVRAYLDSRNEGQLKSILKKVNKMVLADGFPDLKKLFEKNKLIQATRQETYGVSQGPEEALMNLILYDQRGQRRGGARPFLRAFPASSSILSGLSGYTVASNDKKGKYYVTLSLEDKDTITFAFKDQDLRKDFIQCFNDNSLAAKPPVKKAAAAEVEPASEPEPAPAPASEPAPAAAEARKEADASTWMFERETSAEPGSLDEQMLNAAKGGLHRTLSFKLNDGAKPNATDDEGKTPLHLAAEGGHVECIEVLLKRGADWRLKDKGGKTARDYVLELLKDKGGKTARDHALKNNHNDIFRMLQTRQFPPPFG